MTRLYSKKRKDQTFPVARMHWCTDGEGRKNAVKFFEYWKTLTPEQAELASIKVYRAWPPVDLKIGDPERKDVCWDTITGAMPFEVPGDYTRWFISKYGSGEWKLILNEAQVKDSVIECAFPARDPEGSLPIVDLKTVLWGTHEAKGFRDMLKSRNIPIPGDNPEQEAAEQLAQEEEQVQTTAVEALVDTMKETQQQNRELLKQVTEKPVPASAPSVMDHAETKAVDMVSNAATKTIEMVMQHAGKPYDPLEMWKSIMESVPKQDANANIELFKMVLATQANASAKSEAFMMKFMEVRIEEIKAASAVKTETAVAAQPKSFLEQLNEFKAIGEIINPGKRRRSDEDDDEPKRPNWFELLLQNGPQIATVMSPVLMGLGARFGLIQPQPVQQQQQPAVQQNGHQPPPPQPQVHPLVAQMQSQLPPELHKWIPTMFDIGRPFLANFTSPDKDGYALAEHIIGEGLGAAATTQGRADYMVIRENLGPKVQDGKVVSFPFYVLLQAHPTLWPPIHNLPGQLDKFLREFFSYDEMMAAEEEKEEAAV